MVNVVLVVLVITVVVGSEFRLDNRLGNISCSITYPVDGTGCTA